MGKAVKVIDLYIIGGPTASGKTALSIKLAKKINGEIVNADSMQVYKYMNIGTAKPSMEEREGIPHHLMDIIMPDEDFSVVRYCEMAHSVIKDIVSRGKKPILVGGTGLYIDSVANNIKFADIGSDEEYRNELELKAELFGNKYLFNMLFEIDPKSASKIKENDKKRIIRALEIYHISGITKSEFENKSRLEPSPYNVKMYCIDMNRDLLYERINKRVDIMFDLGLAEEVQSIIDMGVDLNCTAMQAIGYKETVRYLKGEETLKNAKEVIKKSTRNYAKRQLTWFRKNPDIIWLKPNEEII